MLISFSVPKMLPYIRAGLLQRLGDSIYNERVKRQTIRRLGTRGKQLLLARDPLTHEIPYDLHLWWKSRTPERELIGVVRAENGPARVYQLTIKRYESSCEISGESGWRTGLQTLAWYSGDEPNAFSAETDADGFDSPKEFRDFFVPNRCDRFDAILTKW